MAIAIRFPQIVMFYAKYLVDRGEMFQFFSRYDVIITFFVRVELSTRDINNLVVAKLATS